MTKLLLTLTLLVSLSSFGAEVNYMNDDEYLEMRTREILQSAIATASVSSDKEQACIQVGRAEVAKEILIHMGVVFDFDQSKEITDLKTEKCYK